MRKKAIPVGQIAVFWTAEGKQSNQTFHTVEGAIAYVESIRKPSRLELDDRTLGYWDKHLGFQPSKKAILEVSPVIKMRRLIAWR